METTIIPESVTKTTESMDHADNTRSSVDPSSNSPQNETHASKENGEAQSCTVDGNEPDSVSNVNVNKNNADTEAMASTTGELVVGDECKTAPQHVLNATAETSASPHDIDAPAEISAAADDSPTRDSSQNQNTGSDANIGVDSAVPPINESISVKEEEDDFVAIELMESAKENNTIQQETREANEDQVFFQNDLHASTQHDTTATAINNSNNTCVPTPQNQIRKKLRHPLLTPLTKLPWDRIATAAGSSCDLLFNCKYSMRQVEDEVREEQKSIQYETILQDDIHTNEDDGNEECDDCVQELGLHCCSMLEDSDDDNEEEGEKQSGEHKQQQQQESAIQGDLLMNEEQKVKSWRGSNPSLDMVFYKQFLDE